MENLRSLIKPPRFQSGAATPWPVRDLVGLARFAYFGTLPDFPLPPLAPLLFLTLSLSLS